MFGTMDTAVTYKNAAKVYWAMKHAIEDNFSDVRFIAHCSHWYDWGTMIYDRFIMDNPPWIQKKPSACTTRFGMQACGQQYKTVE